MCTVNLIPLENGCDVTVYFMLGRTKRCALLSVHNKICTRYAGTVKRHNVRKRHVVTGTGFKQTERTIFLHIISTGLKLQLLSSEFLKKLCQNCHEILEIIFHKTHKRINIQVPSEISVLLHHNTVTNVDEICRCSAVSFSLVTHTEVAGSPAIIQFMLWLVCLEPAITYWR